MAMKKNNAEVQNIPVSSVIFAEKWYPRLETSATTVQKYAEDLDILPPIEINQDGLLIDGWHRWTAHKKVGAETIRAIVTHTDNNAELLELAIERNATHGLQLSQRDKKNIARAIYHETPVEQRGPKKSHLAKILSVTERTVQNWLSRIDKDEKEERDAVVMSMHLACATQQEIADAVGMPRSTIEGVLTEMESLRFPSQPGLFADIEDEAERMDAVAEANRAAALHEMDFTIPIYNVWKQQEKSSGSEHFGNSEVSFVDRLLYLYTNPFDVVVDPFAGGGSTIDICKKRLRRFWVSDRKPIPEREKEIRKADITGELPGPSRWDDVKLVYLDPPYWKQAEGQYSDDPTDLANMPLEQFNKALSGLISDYAKKLKSGAHIALIIQPTQWNAPERQFTDHVGDMLRLVKLPVEMRISAPYESQQCNAQMVQWAKENKNLLVLSREIVVWRIK